MDGWQEVATLEGLQDFLRMVGGLHDGVLKEVHWVNRDFVAESLSMSPYALSDARMIVQRQWANPSAVEIYFESVWSLTLNTVQFIFGSTAGTESSSADLGTPRNLLVLEMESSRVAFERMFWRDASEWMGSEPRFGSFVLPRGH